MPNPTLRRWTHSTFTANTTITVAPVVPASRAFVVSKVCVSNNSSTVSCQFSLLVGGAQIATLVTLNPGEVYSESGLVAPAGELVCQALSTVANNITVSVFGEEVDN